MAKKTKLARSNAAHERLYYANYTPPAGSLPGAVKTEYHSAIIKAQSKAGRVFNKKERRSLFNSIKRKLYRDYGGYHGKKN